MKRNVKHFLKGVIHLHHHRRINQCKWSFDQAAIINGPELINQEIRVLGQASGCRNPDAKRLRVISKVGRKGNDKGRWMVCIQERLCLHNENRAGFPGFGSAARLEVGQPDFATFMHWGCRQWPRTRH